MANDIVSLLTDEEFATIAEQAIDVTVRNRLKELHTSLPGIIQSYDPTKNTAVVQPAIQRVFTDTGPANLPLLFDVPIVFPGGKNFAITFPVTKGDECVLMFFERSMNYWYKSGGVQQPSNFRLHNLSDAVAFVGIRNQSRNLSDIATDGIEIRNEDRSISIKVTDAGITIIGDVAIEGALSATGDASIGGALSVTGDTTSEGVNLKTHTHSGVTGGSGVTGPPV